MTIRSIAHLTGLAALGFILAPLQAAEPFDYFRNSWSVIGLKDYPDGTRISPANELLLADGQRVSFRFGRELERLSRQQTKALLEGWLPVVLLTAQDGPVRYDFTFWATPLLDVEDWQAAFGWPTSGENFVNWISVAVTNTGDQPAAARLAIDDTKAGRRISEWTLNPGRGSVRVVDRICYRRPERNSAWQEGDADVWLKRTVEYWRGLLAGAALIEVPCGKSTEALLAAHVCQLIANDHGELRGGEGFYDEFYIRDGGYQIMELEEAGLFDAAGKAVDRYLASQRPDGRFETQAGQLDANGQAVWVLWQYYKITGDREWLARAYPQMRLAVDWLMNARREAPADSPFAGVLPAAVADGEYLWDGKHHIVGYDFWNLRGLVCTADVARILDKEGEAAELSAEAAHYRQAIDAAWKRTGLRHFPPSWERAGTHWGNTETLWPTELFKTDDPRVVALINHARHEHGGGFVEGTIQWLGRPGAIHPYMSAYTTMASLARGEHEQVVEDFYWYLLHSAATHAFPEGIYHRRRFAWSNTIPHVTGASNYALMLRHMLIHERGEELHLLPAVPDWWLGDGQEIRVERAPTHFGVMGLRVRGTAGGVRVELDRPRRDPPARIVMHLPVSRPLASPLEGVDLVPRPDQKKRRDFASVVGQYQSGAPPLTVRIEGLVPLPLERTLVPAECTMLDLTAVANTDPFTAPFGVANPGRFLFTGMPVGPRTVGGVPFDIIDPAANAGRGFVVLHSPRAPADRTWPVHVNIPVGGRARRAFFLGNVHGWGAGDDGAGEFGAVAEYVIHYAGGQTQTVPLITEQTVEDWTLPHQVAMDVFRGLEGDPWHLNVLGVDLRPLEIDRITFRDLGTTAAPLLAAVTLEK